MCKKIFDITLVLTLVLTIISFILVKPIFASCVVQSVEQLKQRADIVATGTVQNGSNQYFVISVDYYYKGEGPKEIKVQGTSSGNTGVVTSIDVNFKVGQKYLLYLKAPQLNIYTTNLCMGTRVFTGTLTDEEKRILITSSASPILQPTSTLSSTPSPLASIFPTSSFIPPPYKYRIPPSTILPNEVTASTNIFTIIINFFKSLFNLS